MAIELWQSPDWPDIMLDRMAMAPKQAPAPPVPRPGSLWLSRSTGRRATLRWVSGGSVRLDFSDTDKDAHVILAERDLERLYTPIL